MLGAVRSGLRMMPAAVALPASAVLAAGRGVVGCPGDGRRAALALQPE
jgi:hypothetical protein